MRSFCADNLKFTDGRTYGRTQATIIPLRLNGRWEKIMATLRWYDYFCTFYIRFTILWYGIHTKSRKTASSYLEYELCLLVTTFPFIRQQHNDRRQVIDNVHISTIEKTSYRRWERLQSDRFILCACSPIVNYLRLRRYKYPGVTMCHVAFAAGSLMASPLTYRVPTSHLCPKGWSSIPSFANVLTDYTARYSVGVLMKGLFRFGD